MAGLGARTAAASAPAQDRLAAPAHGVNPPPDYPEEARRRGMEGRVALRVQVNSDGTATRVTLQQTSGHPLLDQAALKAVRWWKFLPAMKNGEPIPCEIEFPVVYRLGPP